MQHMFLFIQKGNPAQTKVTSTHLFLLVNQRGFSGITNKAAGPPESPNHACGRRCTKVTTESLELSAQPTGSSTMWHLLFSTVQQANFSRDQLFTSVWYCSEGALQNLLKFLFSHTCDPLFTPRGLGASPSLLELGAGWGRGVEGTEVGRRGEGWRVEGWGDG